MGPSRNARAAFLSSASFLPGHRLPKQNRIETFGFPDVALFCTGTHGAKGGGIGNVPGPVLRGARGRAVGCDPAMASQHTSFSEAP